MPQGFGPMLGNHGRLPYQYHERLMTKFTIWLIIGDLNNTINMASFMTSQM